MSLTNTIITPAPGRIVWVQRTGTQLVPLAAIVAAVHDARSVNLTIFNVDGTTSPAIGVILRQPDDPVPEAPFYAEWMPFQIGQAKRLGS